MRGARGAQSRREQRRTPDALKGCMSGSVVGCHPVIFSDDFCRTCDARRNKGTHLMLLSTVWPAAWLVVHPLGWFMPRDWVGRKQHAPSHGSNAGARATCASSGMPGSCKRQQLLGRRHPCTWKGAGFVLGCHPFPQAGGGMIAGASACHAFSFPKWECGVGSYLARNLRLVYMQKVG